MTHAFMKKKMQDKALQRTQGSALGFAQALKSKRIKEGWTQEALCKGICSVSYLSKVENNVLEPSDYFIKSISKKVGMDLSYYLKTTIGNAHIEEAVDALFYDDKTKLLHLREAISHSFHQRSEELFDLFLSVAFQKVQISQSHISSLEKYLISMDPFTAYTFFVLWGMHCVEVQAFKKAEELMTCVVDFEGLNEKLDALSNTVRFISAQALRKSLVSLPYFEKALLSCQRMHATQHLMHLELTRIYYMIDECVETARRRYIGLKHTLLHHQTSLQHFIDVVFKYHDGTLDAQDFERIKQLKRDRYFYESLLYFPNNVLKANQLSEKKQIFNDIDPRHVLYKVQYETSQKTDTERVHYVKRVALPIAIEKENLFNIESYTDELVREASNQSRYKDALALIQKKNKALKRLRKVKSST